MLTHLGTTGEQREMDRLLALERQATHRYIYICYRQGTIGRDEANELRGGNTREAQDAAFDAMSFDERREFTRSLFRKHAEVDAAAEAADQMMLLVVGSQDVSLDPIVAEDEEEVEEVVEEEMAEEEMVEAGPAGQEEEDVGTEVGAAETTPSEAAGEAMDID